MDTTKAAHTAGHWTKSDRGLWRRDDGAEVTRSGFGTTRPWVGQGPVKNEYVRARLYADSEVKGGASTFKTAENAMRAVDKTFPRATAEARANG